MANARQELISWVWAQDGKLADPPMRSAGVTELIAVTVALQSSSRGTPSRRATGIDAHHDSLRCGWELSPPDGTIALTGMDVAGKRQRVVGFFGELPVA